ncbi:hypothetical protein A0H81_11013 [Grifola frondosa]|uniref:T6SS Phospholipase effector Tle1-like catalytic domain-containing protein n=1 Tax=Grifola frondosa TaxID=5627 RepID=A0A1C7LV81_GRIFR|nr:hypothetical protein A0H81_11013 [Grifola frondosa]
MSNPQFCTCFPESPSAKKGRNLVVCIDGTSQQFGSKNTNVIELYSQLVKDQTQMTYYNSGIGTYAKPSRKTLRHWVQVVDSKIDLAIAWNFDQTVKRAYRWLAENYQDGDRIFMFGFSRGAYQVRTLAAMIDKVGLIHKGNEEQIPFAYALYESADDAEEVADKKTLVSKMLNCIPRAVKRFLKRSQEAIPPKLEQAQRFKETFSRNVKVHFVGVWDTVSSVGLIRHKTLPGTENPDTMCYFRHALALDECRVKFQPEYARGSSMLGKSSGERPEKPSTHRVKEVWFSGSHSDIGGGQVRNSDPHLRHPSYLWISYEAAMLGLKFDKYPGRSSVERSPVRSGWQIHQSMSTMWTILEYLPVKRISYGTGNDTRRPHRAAPPEVITTIVKIDGLANRLLLSIRRGWEPSVQVGALDAVRKGRDDISDIQDPGLELSIVLKTLLEDDDFKHRVTAAAFATQFYKARWCARIVKYDVIPNLSRMVGDDVNINLQYLHIVDQLLLYKKCRDQLFAHRTLDHLSNLLRSRDWKICVKALKIVNHLVYYQVDLYSVHSAILLPIMVLLTRQHGLVRQISLDVVGLLIRDDDTRRCMLKNGLMTQLLHQLADDFWGPDAQIHCLHTIRFVIDHADDKTSGDILTTELLHSLATVLNSGNGKVVRVALLLLEALPRHVAFLRSMAGDQPTSPLKWFDFGKVWNNHDEEIRSQCRATLAQFAKFEDIWQKLQPEGQNTKQQHEIQNSSASEPQTSPQSE